MSNRCQGLPDGPCPDERCDASVKYGIHDLFLCKSCADTRDTMQDTVSKEVAIGKTKPPKKSAKSKDLTSATQGETSGTRTRGAKLNTNSNTKKHTNDNNSRVDCEDVCPGCILPLHQEKRRLKCDICLQTYHQKCTVITEKIYDKILSHIDITGWVCDVCKQSACVSIHKLQAAVAELTEQLATVRAELEDIKNTRPTITYADTLQHHSAGRGNENNEDHVNHVDMDNDIGTRTTLIVQRTINDSVRRKRNVIITGLPESANGDDRSSFMAFCEEHLPIKPALSDNSCIRLGTKQTGRPRRLLVKLNSDEVASSILRAAPSLRRSTEPYVAGNIYINADLSPAAAQLAFEARKARRAATQRRQITGNNTNNTSDTIESIATNIVGAGNEMESSLKQKPVANGNNSGAAVKESSLLPDCPDGDCITITNANMTNSAAEPPSLSLSSSSSSPF